MKIVQEESGEAAKLRVGFRTSGPMEVLGKVDSFLGQLYRYAIDGLPESVLLVQLRMISRIVLVLAENTPPTLDFCAVSEET